jgi:hypothetical protein
MGLNGFVFCAKAVHFRRKLLICRFSQKHENGFVWQFYVLIGISFNRRTQRERRKTIGRGTKKKIYFLRWDLVGFSGMRSKRGAEEVHPPWLRFRLRNASARRVGATRSRIISCSFFGPLFMSLLISFCGSIYSMGGKCQSIHQKGGRKVQMRTSNTERRTPNMLRPLYPEHHLSPTLSPTSWRRGRRTALR